MYIKLNCEKYRLDKTAYFKSLNSDRSNFEATIFLILQNVVVVPAVSVLPAAGLWLTGLYFLLD